MSGLPARAPERPLLAAAGLTAGGTPPPPESPIDACKRLFNALMRARHAALAHLRTHAVGTFCPECRRFIDSDAEAQAAYTAAWHALFDHAPAPVLGIGAPLDPPGG